MRLNELRKAAEEYEDILWIRKNEYKPMMMDVFVKSDYDEEEIFEFFEQNFIPGWKYHIIKKVPCYDCPACTADPNEPDYLICLVDRHHAVTETNLYIECPNKINIIDDD